MPGFSINTGSGETNTVRTARSHRWRIERLGPLGSDPLGFGPGTWYAKSFGFPEVSSEKIKTEGAAVDYWHAGRVQYSAATLVFYDAISASGTSFGKLLNDWVALVHAESSTGELSFSTVGQANNYKHKSVFQLEAASGNGGSEPTFELTLVNSWPSKLQHSDLDYSDSAISEFTIELTFDWYLSKNLSNGGDLSQGPLLLPPGLLSPPSI